MAKQRMQAVTPAQITAVAGSFVGVAAAYGAPIPAEAADGIVQTVQIVAPSLIAADFGLRFNRARVFGERLLDHDDSTAKKSLRVETGQLVFAALTFSVAITALIVTLLT